MNDVVEYGNADVQQALIDDIRAIYTEGTFNSRWELVAMYHAIGRRITSDHIRADVYGKKILSQVTQSTGISERNLYRAMQFYEAYPDLRLLPNGKAISWHRIVNEILPEPSEKPEPPKEKRCPNCNFLL